MFEAYLDPSGRIRRWRFFIYSILLWIITPLLGLLAVAFINNARYTEIATVLVMVMIGLFWAGMALVVKRLHDIDKSGWHYVWMYFLPCLLTGGLTFQWKHGADALWSTGFQYSSGIISLLATLYLISARGSDGPKSFRLSALTAST